MKANNDELRQRMLLGLGFDNKDGHKRYTKGDDFVLMGGSEETHEKNDRNCHKSKRKTGKKRQIHTHRQRRRTAGYFRRVERLTTQSNAWQISSLAAANRSACPGVVF